MQRAAAGESFNVTRPGRSYVRLTGPRDPLEGSPVGRYARITLKEPRELLPAAS